MAFVLSCMHEVITYCFICYEYKFNAFIIFDINKSLCKNMHKLSFCKQNLSLPPKFDITLSWHGFVIIIYKFPFINKGVFYYPYIFHCQKYIYIRHLHILVFHILDILYPFFIYLTWFDDSQPNSLSYVIIDQLPLRWIRPNLWSSRFTP